jgi:hypothetical protein
LLSPKGGKMRTILISLFVAALANAAPGKGGCTVTATPWVTTFNSTSGTPKYTNGIGKTAQGRVTTVLGQQVILAAAGGTDGSVVDVFFLDLTGKILDGTAGWAQPHLTLATPEPSFYSMIIADVNGDGIPDLVLGARNFGVGWVHLGQGGGTGTLSFLPAKLLTPPQGNSGFGAALAVGDLNGDGINEIALGLTPFGSGKKVVLGGVYLFKWNGISGGFDNYQTITDPQNSSSSSFGQAVAIGDITGDSRPELVVGASGSGRAWVFYGSGLSSSFYLTASGLGTGVAIANMTGAPGGFADLLAITDFQSTKKGYIYAGAVTSGETPASVLQPAEVDWPQSALDIGDIHGDGLADVMMGSESTGCSGSAYLYLNSASGFTSQVFVGPPPRRWSRGPRLCWSGTSGRRKAAYRTPAKCTFIR